MTRSWKIALLAFTGAVIAVVSFVAGVIFGTGSTIAPPGTGSIIAPSETEQCKQRVYTAGYFYSTLEPFLREHSLGWGNVRGAGGPHTVIFYETVVDGMNTISTHFRASYRYVSDLNGKATIGMDWQACRPVVLFSVVDTDKQ